MREHKGRSGELAPVVATAALAKECFPWAELQEDEALLAFVEADAASACAGAPPSDRGRVWRRTSA